MTRIFFIVIFMFSFKLYSAQGCGCQRSEYYDSISNCPYVLADVEVSKIITCNQGKYNVSPGKKKALWEYFVELNWNDWESLKGSYTDQRRPNPEPNSPLQEKHDRDINDLVGEIKSVNDKLSDQDDGPLKFLNMITQVLIGDQRLFSK